MTSNGEHRYKMTVAGQLFKHLGLQMYSGAVPAISELISNAYDAMARNVWITIPAGRSISQRDEIVVKDDGHGMTFQECNNFYLLVGRDRRPNQSGWTEEYNGLISRKVQGRKGIGKLAGFGIANLISVRTVKDGEIAHFEMDYDELTKSSSFTDENGYFPSSLSEDAKQTDEQPSTSITLSRLKISRSIAEGEFKSSIARRLLVLDENFTVHVNGTPISRQEIPFQFRFPKNAEKWETDELDNKQQFQWWAGFCKGPIPNEEQRGFVVYVRGKLAQTPWFFDLSGGVWGQHGMQYLTGEIQADFLDESVDLISTDRGTVRWEDPVAVPLREWGRKKIQELLVTWADKRREEKIKSPKVKSYLEQAEKLPERERRIFKKVVEFICAIPQLDKDQKGKDIADELVEFVYNALTNRSFLEAIRQLNMASPNDIAQFTEVLSEWDIIEAVNTAHLIKGRMTIIHTFEQMIESGVREKPDMQDYLKLHPWLIDPKWAMLAHEQSLDKIIREQFQIPALGEQGGLRRPDFFCLGDSQTAYVVEAKRPGDLVGKEEFNQVEEYVIFLRRSLQEGSTTSEHRRAIVKGLLIADRIRPGEEQYKVARQGLVDFRTWENLLRTAITMHKDFFDLVKERAPADDPRMKSLSEDPLEEQEVQEQNEG